MRKSIRVVTGLVVATAAVTWSAVPSWAGPPDKFEVPLTFQFPDLDNELVVFVNIDRASYCTDDVVAFETAVIAWLHGGMVGDFPDEPEFPDGFAGLSVALNETGQGAIVASARGSDLTIELWHLDAEGDRPLVGPCTDTDDGSTLFASGTTTMRAQDNDRFGSGTRGYAFGDSFNAAVVDADGNEYSYSHRFHVAERCHVPTDGLPACFRDTFTLRAK